MNLRLILILALLALVTAGAVYFLVSLHNTDAPASAPQGTWIKEQPGSLVILTTSGTSTHLAGVADVFTCSIHATVRLHGFVRVQGDLDMIRVNAPGLVSGDYVPVSPQDVQDALQAFEETCGREY
jgi:hypothetical protein